jgi:PAS domain S-box-containing protein
MNTKILIVDDDEANRITLDAILSRDRYDIHLAANGTEGCAMARNLVPDLILLDVMMPDMDGFEVCRLLRADPVLSRVPILMITALNDQESRITGIDAGADDFISKPCAIDELRARVRTIIRLNRFRVIAEQRTRFEQLFALTPSAIILVSPEGIISTANDLAVSLLQPLDPAPLQGRPVSMGVPSAAADRISRLITQTCLPDSPPEHIQIELPSADGGRIFSLKASLLKEGGLPLVLLILHDVTAEVRAREELQSVNTRLDAMVRDRTRQLEIANELLLSYTSFVSHDLRSPLSAVRGYLSMLDGGVVPVSDEARPLINSAFIATGMMEDMVGNILDMAADEHHARVPSVAIDPRPVLEKLAWKIACIMPKPRPQITVGTLPLVHAAAPLLERVFYNLVSNSIKYAAKDREVRIEIGSVATPTGTALYVRDNGTGFDSAQSASLFKAFSRLPGSEHREGLGLGLSLISRLLGAHQGRIWAEGRPGEGATFFVEFKQAGVSSAV